MNVSRLFSLSKKMTKQMFIRCLLWIVIVGTFVTDTNCTLCSQKKEEQKCTSRDNKKYQNGGSKKQKKIAMARHGQPKYNQGFTHFSSLNPHAPKGGILRIGVVGSFDSTNPNIVRGSAPVGLSLVTEKLVFEGLMKRSFEEPYTLYANIAESVELASDNSSITFHLNPKAQFSDGTPLTSEDVSWTFHMLRTKGLPVVRVNYARIDSVKIIGPHTIKFSMKKNDQDGYDAELPLAIALMDIMSKSYFQNRVFDRTGLDPIVGSGPYVISKIDPGHRIIYRRRLDYWGKDLPVNRGYYNFDTVDVRYYRDMTVLRQAFLIGEINLIHEYKPQEWTQFYTFEKNKNGPVKKIDFEQVMPKPLMGFALNLRRPFFQNPKVREALLHMLDFEWMNTNLYHQTMQPFTSFFMHLDYRSKENFSSYIQHAKSEGMPDSVRQALDLIQNEVNEGIISKNVFGESARKRLKIIHKMPARERLRRAKMLLDESGYHVYQGKLVDKVTRKPIVLEILVEQRSQERLALEYSRQLKPLGIQVHIKLLDPAQMVARRTDHDFDIMFHAFFCASRSPGVEQKFYWNSDFADMQGSRNIVGFKSKTVDYVIEQLIRTKNLSEMKMLLNLLDRILMSHTMVIPFGFSARTLIAHEDTLHHPELHPQIPIELRAWWSSSH